MNFDDLLIKYVNKEHKPREVGRYYASEIISIKKGYQKASDFFLSELRSIDLTGCKRIASGNILEGALAEMLKKAGIECTYNGSSKEIEFDGIKIAVKPDFEFKTCVFETKAQNSSKTPEQSLEYYKYQLECEYRVCQKPVYLVRLGIEEGNIWQTPQAYRYHESEKVFDEVKEIVLEYHKKVLNFQKKYGK